MIQRQHICAAHAHCSMRCPHKAAHEYVREKCENRDRCVCGTKLRRPSVVRCILHSETEIPDTPVVNPPTDGTPPSKEISPFRKIIIKARVE